MSKEETAAQRYEHERQEILAEERELVANSHRLKHLMNELKDFEPFQEYVKRLKAQIEQRRSVVFAFPSNGLDNVVQNLYTSGEVAGLQLAIDLPDVMLDYAQLTIDGQDAKDEANIDRTKANENG